MAEFVRVRNSKTGREYTTALVTDDEKVIDEPAIGRNGQPLPGKPIEKKTSAASKPAAKTTASKSAAAPSTSSKADKEATK